MCSKDDFFNWSDIDLDAVLGEYTDDDVFTTDSCAESDSATDLGKAELDSATQRGLYEDAVVTKSTKIVARSKALHRHYIYCCPVCAN